MNLVAPRHMDPPGPGMEPVSPALAGGFFTTEARGKPVPRVLMLYVDFFRSLWELLRDCSQLRKEMI